MIAAFPQPLGKSADGAVRGGRRCGFAAEVSKGMDYDLVKSPFVGEPFDVFQGLAENRAFSVRYFVGSLSMDEDDDAVRYFLVYINIGHLRNGLRVGFPVKTFGLEAQKLHGVERSVAVQEVL